MSLGSGHVWTNKRSDGGLLGIECTRCGKRQNYPLAFFDSMRSRPRRGKLCRFKMRVPTGRRPLGTCSGTT